MSRFSLPSLFQLLVPVVVIAFAGPLAALAGLTTGIACFALWFRLQLVYLDMGVSIAYAWVISLITPRSKEPSATHKHYLAQHEARQMNPTTPPTLFNPGEHPLFMAQPYPTTARPRSSKSMASSVASLHSDSYTSLLMTAAPANRDYEGVGGWRALHGSGDDEDDENEDNTWSSLNARLELPTVTSATSLAALVQSASGNNSRESMGSSGATAPGEAGAASGTATPAAGGAAGARSSNHSLNSATAILQPRRHVRSLTGGSASSYSLKMSPVLGRSPVMARSPAASMMREHQLTAADGYFGNASASGSGSASAAAGGSAQHGAAASSTQRSSGGLFASVLGSSGKKSKSLHGD